MQARTMMESLFERVRREYTVTKICHVLGDSESKAGSFSRCPVCGSGRFQITNSDTAWTCWAGRCHERAGKDALGLASSVWQIDRVEAARKLLGGEMPSVAHISRPGPVKVETSPEEQKAQEAKARALWGGWVSEVVGKSRKYLLSRNDELSRRAWAYLTMERGLSPEIIEWAGLGLNAHWVISHEAIPGKRATVAPGLLLPWNGGGKLTAVNVREFHEPFKDGNRYLIVKGGKRQYLYPGPRLYPYDGPILVTEGEFDCLAAQQALAGLTAVVTMGSGSVGPRALVDTERAALAGFTRYLIAADDDDAGRKCRDMWESYSRRALSLTLPKGHKDLNEAHVAGVDLRAWYCSELDRLGVSLGLEPGVDVPEREGFHEEPEPV
jgi:hypothetical protein